MLGRNYEQMASNRLIVWLTMTLSVVLWPAVAIAQAAPQGQLTIAQGTDAVTMDPHNTTQMTAMQPFNFVFNKLLNRDKDMKLVPELAVSWRSVDELTCYVVEVCVDCGWNHLDHHYLLGRRHAG